VPHRARLRIHKFGAPATGCISGNIHASADVQLSRNDHGRTIMLFSRTAAALTAVFLVAIVVTATIA
jgi:hypothetical protein